MNQKSKKKKKRKRLNSPVSSYDNESLYDSEDEYYDEEYYDEEEEEYYDEEGDEDFNPMKGKGGVRAQRKSRVPA